MSNVTNIDEKRPGWFSRHSDELVFGVVCVASLVVPVAMGFFLNKAVQKENAIRAEKVEKVSKMINEAIARGDTVLPGGEFGVWVIPKNRAS